MQTLTIYTDGGARGNPGPAASGAVIDGLAGKPREICGKYLGETTNNVAEYMAVVIAYERILQEDIDPQNFELNFFMDSLLVNKQLLGEYKIKNPNLAILIQQIKAKEKLFGKVTYQHIRREFNKLADREVNRVLDEQAKR